MTAYIGRHLLRLSGALSIAPRPILLRSPTVLSSPVWIEGAIRNYAARKGTRTRKEKAKESKKAAKKEKEAGMPAHLKKLMMKKMRQGQHKSIFPDDSERPVGTDNVFLTGVYKWPLFDLKIAIQNFKETHHPTMFDNPKAVIKAYFELDLSTKKKTQFVEHVSGVIELPHRFESGRPIKTVCVFCKDQDLIASALSAGADAAVGVEGVRMFQEGNLDSEDYDVILSHPDILVDLAPIRGLISKKFPNMKRGTVGFDVVNLVKKYKNGVDYNMSQSLADPKLGLLQVPIGLVDMAAEEMAENFEVLVEAVLTHKPVNVSNSFITIGAITSEFSNERFKVVMDPLLAKIKAKTSEDESDGNSLEKKAARV